MWKFHVVVLQFAFVALCAWSVSCMNKKDQEAIAGEFEPMAKECLKECGLDTITVKDDDIDPCMKKCFLKKTNVLDDKGMYDPKVMEEQMNMFAENKDETNKKLDSFEKCFAEKGENVATGDEAETKRVKVIFECLRETGKIV